MKALVLTQPESYPRYQDFPEPESSDTEVVVEVLAAALNRRDYWICKGLYPKIQYPIVLGSDLVGLLNGEKVVVNPGLNWGSDERFQSKEFEVLGLPRHGSFAEKVVVPKENVYAMPGHLTDIQAAALPLAGVTAFRSIFSRAQLTPSEKCLITGVGGGVASIAVQFAMANGNQTYVTSGDDEKIEQALKEGVAAGENYRVDGWSQRLKKSSGGFDVIVDSAGGQDFGQLVKLLNPGGRIVFYGGTQGTIEGVSPQVMFWKQTSILGSTMGSPQDFRSMLDFVDKHKIVPKIDSVFDLAEGTNAFEKLAQSSQNGKIVLKVK